MEAMPKATGLFEAHLTVGDLDRSVAFYRDVVGLPVALEVPERRAAFLWIGGRGDAMLGLWSLGSAPMAVSLHIALAASRRAVLGACEALRSKGVAPLSFFGDDTTEPSVIGWMPAAAVYFRDPDGHLIEYLAMLDEPPRPDRGIIPWSAWRAADTDDEPIQVRAHTGPRSALRRLFEEAEDSARELDTYIDAGEVLIATVGDRVVGHLQLIDSPGDDASEIKNMAVEAAYRGHGIGRRLVEAAIDLAGAHDHSTVKVATAAADIGNLRFYQRVGFRMREIERDAFTPIAGYPPGLIFDGIRLRDRVWLDLQLDHTPNLM
jgi:GNAT superfamily N-acetyltransferase/catechol 2,3-dioxygenase-like lactoylglutathione lyase family enzyme